MIDQCIPVAESWLRENTNLGTRQRKAMAALCPLLINSLSTRPGSGKPLLISLGGAPGSGKSTLARMLCFVLNQAGRRCQLLSLDDFYLTLAARQLLARQIHRLCSVRGVPGTHDLPLLLDHLEHLIRGDYSGLRMPQFDKASDDRHPSTAGYAIEAPLDYILLEGWLCGAPPMSDADLACPLNRLEREQDPHGTWRRWVNLNLREYHGKLDPMIDFHWFLKAPGWDSVVAWRFQQEQELAAPALRSKTEVEDFLMHYQRLVAHMLKTADSWADLIIALDAAHCASIPSESINGLT
jgi:D-glycerate 3-kinase